MVAEDDLDLPAVDNGIKIIGSDYRWPDILFLPIPKWNKNKNNVIKTLKDCS